MTMTDSANQNTAPAAPPAEPAVPASNRIRVQVEDALTMLKFAVETGFKTKDDRRIPPEVISTIQTIAAKLGFLDDPESWDTGGENTNAITVSEWVRFELAYYDLADALSPITAETLQNTERTSYDVEWSSEADSNWRDRLGRFSRNIGYLLLGYSPAQRFARALSFTAIGFALFVIVSEWGLTVLGQDGDTKESLQLRTILKLLVPWAYGGLGSCVYLLKSAHYFIYERCFDLRRKSEYFNRILLGTVSGGAIILFANQFVGDEGSVAQLGTAALGFLAGYSTDFLFNTIERVIAALFPKVPPAQTPPPKPSTRSRTDGTDKPAENDTATAPATEGAAPQKRTRARRSRTNTPEPGGGGAAPSQ